MSGFKVRAPHAVSLVAGKKTVELRTGITKYLWKPVVIIQTPGATDIGTTVGIVVFVKCEPIANISHFMALQHAHLQDESYYASLVDRQQKRLCAWHVGASRKFHTPINCYLIRCSVRWCTVVASVEQVNIHVLAAAAT